jgi:hypothetical protein
MESDVAYFTRRAAEEREAAKSASHAAATHAHLAMADRYSDFVEAIGRSEKHLGLSEISEYFSTPREQPVLTARR